jgi:hypothetical protein
VLPRGIEEEAPSALVGSQIVAQTEKRLEVPECVFVDLTPLTPVERERSEDNLADVVG